MVKNSSGVMEGSFVLGPGVKVVSYVWGDRRGRLCVHETHTDVLQALGADPEKVLLVKKSDDTYVLEQKKKKPSKNDRFEAWKAKLPSGFVTKYFERLRVGFDWSKLSPFLRPGIVYDAVDGWFGYPEKNTVPKTPLSIEYFLEHTPNLGIVCLKGDSSLPSSYVFGDGPYKPTIDYLAMFEKLADGKDHLLLKYADSNNEVDMFGMGIERTREIELLLTRPVYPQTREALMAATKTKKKPAKKRALEMPKEELMQLAKQTKQNTTAAIQELKEELRLMSGGVGKDVPVDDAGAAFRMDPAVEAREILKRSKIDEDSSSDPTEGSE